MSTRQIQLWASPRRILLATGLVDLKFTLPVAIRQALTYKAELKIAHVLPDAAAPVVDPVLMMYSDPDRMRRTAEEELKSAAEQAETAGVACGYQLVSGNVVNELIEIAAQWKAERIVAGSHGKSKHHMHMLGSAAESIFHRSEVPVLAVGPKVVQRTLGPNDRMRIVFATKLDQGARRIAEFALSVAENHQADVWMVHVVTNVVQEHPTAGPVRAYASRMMQDLIRENNVRKCNPVCDVVYGPAVESSLAYAARQSADMIVMGASAHSAFDARFIPGTAYRVLCDSARPVLVLKQESVWVQKGLTAEAI